MYYYLNVQFQGQRVKKLEGLLMYGDESVHVRQFAMETWMSGALGVAPHILKLRPRQRHVRSLTPRPLHTFIIFL